MKLFYSPSACSMAPHIVSREAGINVDLVKVDIPNKKTAAGDDYWKVNFKGYVPTLQLDNGEVLTEVGVICQYLSDQKPESVLAPKPGTMERYRLMEWLNFIATEIHKGLGPLWKPTTPDAYKATVLAGVGARFDHVVAALGKKPYLTGDAFTIADAYLFTIVNWQRFLAFDIDRWPALQQFQARVAARPSVQRALADEHLAKAA